MSNSIIDRDTYRRIKKMSREELQAFLMRYAQGLSSQNIVDLKAMETDIKSVKGIGEKEPGKSCRLLRGI